MQGDLPAIIMQVETAALCTLFPRPFLLKDPNGKAMIVQDDRRS